MKRVISFEWLSDAAGLFAMVAIAALALVYLFAGCAAAKPVLRTIDDAASILCETAFGVQEQAQKEGLSVHDWCAIHEHLRPFIQEALKARAAAAQQAGLAQPHAPPPGDAGK
jgi:hypothetical protein